MEKNLGFSRETPRFFENLGPRIAGVPSPVTVNMGGDCGTFTGIVRDLPA